ncbi:cysteine desulfuration protein SufE [Pseudomonas sp. FW306-02-F02-AA]|uniref:Fe-S metabolism protein SufE n=1 Tax=Pseudomonas fluorescens TaxID=294 RepID=A0A0N9VVG2_PSEFL|nr:MULTISPECIES: SufE family protein [Pseudomonas]ALI02583.1 Fe-S metabolism protein SufE [Pseudomonas fluorescens]PMZ05025.1 cysteine desulfuration protein SufE [Pseudomonas sp. FW306-02-F02-AB]PMZ10906.1 cysteine desulfuration protein SufE [Pseudomonas sp. FW306-02-H06C]PMZ13619.1 cysteine desulfuration protein SufE [Pseudomonas sp. FW306-02-F02-AA]PMZ22604.1 cysteine desulfuration protein SufE [Pseudomonas sp. FW306-02-F08-AA]
MSLPTDAITALETFQAAAGWEQRARLLMQWGERLPALSDADKTEANRVHGCESQVWLVGALHDGHWQFAASSDARLIRGLVALLLARVNGLTAAELQQVDLPDWFNQLGLSRQLSSSRSNGLNAVLQRMRELST